MARLVTGTVGGSLVAGVIYAFAPSRFTHYEHLELQLVLDSAPVVDVVANEMNLFPGVLAVLLALVGRTLIT